MWLKQEGQVERCNNVVKAATSSFRFRDATMWLKQEGQVERSNNVVKQEGKVERCNNVVKARRLGCEMQKYG